MGVSMQQRHMILLLAFCWFVLTGAKSSYSQEDKRVMRAGAAAVDITPTKFPVIVNGMFEQRTARGALDRLMSRALVLDDGKTRLAIVVVDNLMIKRELLDQAKQMASKATKIPPERMLISATHTHSAPSVMGCLGSDADPAYVQFLPAQIAKSIAMAAKNVVPARIGWTVVQDKEHSHCRRWIFRPDRVRHDPFGRQNVRAHMHPGHRSKNHVGPSGPADPDLSLLAVETADGKPLAVVGNYAMHYYGSGLVSADFCGRFGDKLAKLIRAESSTHKFVGMMSQGTSGDGMWMDYGRPAVRQGLDKYTEAVASLAATAYRSIKFHDWVPLAMDEAKLKLRRRVPDPKRLAWAKKTYPQALDTPSSGRLGQRRIYAREARLLHAEPEVELKLQAVRIGELGITAIPNEVYAITGLKLKAQSPLAMTFNIELANGAQGYIPPPEQHKLGGYTTWPARTAGLEVEAEPKIVATLVRLLENVADAKRKSVVETPTDYATTILAAKPLAYWRLGEMVADKATDATNRHHAKFAGGVAMYLPGPGAAGLSAGLRGNRAVHLAGGHMQASLNDLKQEYTVSLWFWNGLPHDVRPVTGTLFARGNADAQESLFVGGKVDLTSKGKLVFRSGGKTFTGSTPLRTKFWHHATIVRNKNRASVYLDGNPVAEINAKIEAPAAAVAVFVGGNNKLNQSLEGKIDEVAVFDRALTTKEMASHYAASKMTPPPRPKPKQVLPAKPSDAKSLKRFGDAVMASKPVSFWRLHDNAKAARDQIDSHSGRYEKGARPYNPGKKTANFSGGRMNVTVPSLGNTYSVEFWFRNELAHHARPVTGYMFSRGDDGSKLAAGDHLGIGGTFDATGRLIVFNGNERNQLLAGATELVPHSWNHVVLVRDQRKVFVYLNGDATPEMQGDLAITYPKNCRQLFIGGRNDNFAGFLGAIDEVAFYNRALRPKEVTAHFVASGVKPVIQPRAAQKKMPRPLTIAESLKQIKIRDGFELQLVAAEPLVKDPVAIDWGPDGKLWVVEMADYPLGIDGKGKPGGRVRFLEDKNGDGRYDTSTLLADGLRFPTGILSWGNGVLVTAAPDILYLEDTDGDGKADVRETLFTGFLEGNQQLRVNGLRWGLDNWIHCASGSHHAGHGKGNWITSHVTNKKTKVGSRDFRIRPAAGLIDPQSGPSQYGRNRDDWGNWFGVQNSHPLWHYVLADHYIRRNRYFAPPDPRQQVVTPTNPRVYPAKPPQKRFHSFNQSGRFTSACSAMIYRDELLFARGAQQHAFTCEPFHNLVQHNVITDHGVSFGFHRDAAETKHDFFASADRWCRPVMVRTGPDGALWVVDMYRFMIEHPQWLPKIGKDELRPFYRFGDDRGRIYRIVPKGRSPRNVPRLDKLSAVQLVAALQSPSGWQRDMVQRMLVAKQDKTVVGPLVKMSRGSEQPLARLHALCTLDGLDALTAETVQAALGDKHPAVRRHAVRLAEGRSVDTARLAALVNDPNAKVRLQLACTLGYSEGPRAGRALADLAIANSGDRYITAAVMSSINRTNLPHVLVSVITPRDGRKPPKRLVKTLFSQAAAIGEDKIIADALGLVTHSQDGRYQPWQFSALGQMLDVLAKRNWRPDNRLDASQLAKVHLAIKRARGLIAASDIAEPLRAAAACLILRQAEHRQSDMQLAIKLLAPRSPSSVQQAIVARAADCSEKQIAAMLLTGWRSHGPALRAEILSVVASRAMWIDTLLQRLESGDVSSAEIDASMRQRLLATKSKPIRARLQKVLAGATTSDRQQVLTTYRAALKLTGNAKRGEVLFAKQCANCHRNGKLGSEVGPNLASLTTKTPESLLSAIIDPSAAVESKYLSYNVITKDGKSLAGMIVTETGSSITLLAAGGKRESLLRGDIEALQSSGKSLMPDGLEKQLKPQDLSDLIEFVRNLGGKR